MISATDTLAGRDLLSITDLGPDDIGGIVSSAIRLKTAPRDRAALAGVRVAMLFEKPSLRTRASFEFGLAGLGAHPVYFDLSGSRIGERESVKDYAMNLERWCDTIVARVFDHEVLVEMAGYASVPVVNALSDREHPCQTLADLLTVREALGTLGGKRLAFIGDGNNVCRSLMLGAASAGLHITVVAPDGYGPDAATIERTRAISTGTGASVRVEHEPGAVRGHDVVYTDTWVSMGDDPAKAEAFGAFAVNESLMSIASDGVDGEALFMHCLPAKRGQEVTAEVIDGARSIVYDQAENRMHAQNALMLALLGSG